jgi:hypothetical protein
VATIIDPVAMAPLALLVTDNIAAWALRDTMSISVRTGQQLQLGGDRGKAWPEQDLDQND